MSIKPGLKLIFFPLFSHFCKKSKNLSAKSTRKIYPQILSAKSIRKIYPQNLSAKSIRKIYPQNLSAILVRNFYSQNLSAKYIRNFYPLSAIRTRIFCQTLVVCILIILFLPQCSEVMVTPYIKKLA